MKKCPELAVEPLSPEAKRLRAAIVSEYALEDAAGLAILNVAMQAHDRMRQAQRAVVTDGATTRDRFNQVKAHPMLVVERDARAAFLAAIKALGLDLEPLHDGPGRPAGHTSRNHDG